MFQVNENYLKLPGSYLFSNHWKKSERLCGGASEETVIRLGIGDVTQPLPPVVIEALHKAVDEMGNASTFHGYAPDLGYEFLRKAVAEKDFQARGCQITRTRFSFPTAPSRIPPTFRRFLRRTAGSRSAIRLSGIRGLQRDGGQDRHIRCGRRDLERCDLHALHGGKRLCTGAPRRSARI